MSARIPGAEVLAVLTAEARAIREKAVAASEDRDVAAAELNRLNETQNAVLTRLAEIALPSLSHADINETHSGVRQRLRELAERRQRSEEELTARKRRLENDLARREQAVTDAAARANERVAAFTQRQNELAQHLAQDPDYQSMKQGCEQAKARIERDQARMAEVEQDTAEKLPDYENSKLFQYLQDRDYGTANYDAWGPIKSIDRRVARLIDFASLRESYHFLTTVPGLMRDELKKREAEVDAIVEQMMRAVSQAEETFGIDGLEADATEANEVHDRLKGDRDRISERVEAVQEEIAEVRSNENRFYDEALNELKRFLQGVESDILARQADRTETIDDDDAVAELRACRLDADAAAARVTNATALSEKQAALADGIDFVLRRARQTDLGSERAHFPRSFDATEPLRQFEKGVIDRRRFLEVLQEAAELDPTWAERAYERGSEIANSRTAQTVLGTAASAIEPLLREAMRRR